MAISKVVVVDGNNLIVRIDRGVAGRGVTDVEPIEIDGSLYLVFTFSDGTTETVGPVGTIQYIGQTPIVVTGSTISLSTVPVNLGGTGQTTANAGFNALAPTQTGNAGKYLKTDGTNSAWDLLDISTADITGVLPIANGGTNASTASGARTNLGLGTIATQDASAVAITGGSITGITDLAVADGGTGASTAAGARTNLNAADQALTLTAGTGLSGGGDLSANRTFSITNTGVTAASYGSASNTLTATVNAQGQLTALAATPIAIANTQVSGLGTMSTQNSNAVTITGGSITGITDLAIADGGTGASNAADARSNLGLGTAAVLNAGVANGVATLDAGGTVPLSQIPASIQGGVSYQGAWNASTNTPTLTSSVGTKGHYYVVSVAGNTNLNGVTDWLVGDWAIYNGTAWEKIDNTDQVASVNGYTGVVVLTNTDVGAPPTSLTISAGTGLSGGGNLTTNRTLSIANTAVSAGSYGTASAVPSFTVNGQGQLTAASDVTIAISNTQVSGLGTMSTQNANSVAITGGSITGITDLAIADGGTGASTAGGALTNLGAIGTITSTDGSIVVTPSGTTVDLAVSAASPASTLLTQVRNTTGATLTKGTVVYISGATGQIATVSKAIATGDATSAQTLGMITSDLANNSNGYVTVFGLLENMDTSAYTDGAQLYLSGTTAGAVTATKPSAPTHLVYVAVVEYAHPTQGKLLVKVQNGYELDEIHDVSIVSPTTGQTLVYSASTDLWSNSNAPVISGTTINNTTIGATTASSGAFTTLSASSSVTLSGGTANGVTYLNGSKQLTSGSALTFDSFNRLGIQVTPISTGANGDDLQIGDPTTNVGAGLTIGSTTTADIQFSDAISGTGQYAGMLRYSHSNDSMQFWTASSEQMRLTSTGLGIGTSSPTNALTVDGNANITGNTTLGDASTDTVRVNGYMGVGGAGASTIGLYVRSTALTGTTQYGVSSTVTASSSATTALWAIEGAPNTPAESFSVSNVAAFRASNASKGAGSTITNQHGVYIADQINGTNNYGITSLVSSGTNKWNIYASGTADNYFAGNVGIGTSSPSENLDVSASINGGGPTINVSNTYYAASSTDEYAEFQAEFYQNDVSARRAAGYMRFGKSGDFSANASASSFLAFATRNAGTLGEKMRLDASGNLGLGVTPSAWGTGYKALDIQYLGISNTVAGTVDCSFTQNGYYDGTNWIAKYTSPSKRYSISDSGFIWYNGASTTAGTAITFTQAMTLNSSGNLGIGTSSPASKLDVSSASGNNAIISRSTTATNASVQIAGNGNTAGSTSFDLIQDNTYAYVYQRDSKPLVFGTSSTERARIDASGNLLVGTTSNPDTARLHVSKASGEIARFSSPNGTSSYITVGRNDATGEGFTFGYNSSTGDCTLTSVNTSHPIIFKQGSTERARIDASGNLLVGKTALSGTSIGFQFKATGELNSGMAASTNSDSTLSVYSTGASAYRFYVGLGGTVYATSTTITAISDQRLKENIRDLDDGLDVVMALKPRKFDWKEGKGQNIKNARGFIAQEFETVLPDMIEEWRDPAPEGEEAYKAINANLIPTLVKAIQELKAEFDAYKASHP